jgi:hypothetical protein
VWFLVYVVRLRLLACGTGMTWIMLLLIITVGCLSGPVHFVFIL